MRFLWCPMGATKLKKPALWRAFSIVRHRSVSSGYASIQESARGCFGYQHNGDVYAASGMGSVF